MAPRPKPNVERSVSETNLTIDDMAKQIILDGFRMQKYHPKQLVASRLPIPVARRCRNRLAKKNGVYLDSAFHSLFDKAIHRIETTVTGDIS